MKLGMPILYEYNSLEENFKLAKELGLDFVELNLNFPYCRTEMEEGNVKKLLDKYGLEATLHFYDEADFGSYLEVCSAYLMLLLKYLNLSKDYIKIINFHNNVGPIVTISGERNYIYEKEYSEYIERVVKNFKAINELLDSNNIKMVIENIDDKAPFLMKNFLRFNQEGFNFNFDIGHDHVIGDKFYELIKTNDFKLLEFHFHDCNEVQKKCHLALASGTMDLKEYKELAIKNDSYVVLEVKSSDDLIKSVPIFKSL